MANKRPVVPRAARPLFRLAKYLRSDAFVPWPPAAADPESSIQAGAKLADPRTVSAGLARGLWVICRSGDCDAPHLQLTDAGRAWLARQRSVSDLAFRVQHEAVKANGDNRDNKPVRVDEWPIGRLARRRGRNGAPLISAVQLQAAEQLRRDFTLGAVGGNARSNWRVAPGSGGASREQELQSACALDHRAAFDTACLALGPELAGVLIDACCFLKGMEQIEQERCWPVRSAKIVITVGLNQLARHYALAD